LNALPEPAPADDPPDPLERVRRALSALSKVHGIGPIPTLRADGAPIAGGLPSSPVRRFILDGAGRELGPVAQYRAPHPDEPLMLAAGRDLGPGTVREAPGLSRVLATVRDTLEHLMVDARV